MLINVCLCTHDYVHYTLLAPFIQGAKSFRSFSENPTMYMIGDFVHA